MSGSNDCKLSNLFLPFIRVFQRIEISFRVFVVLQFISDLPVQLVALLLNFFKVHELQKTFGNLLQLLEINERYVGLYFKHIIILVQV